MDYKWLGMRVLAWEGVRKLHEDGNLAGVYRLYSDGTENKTGGMYG